MERWKKVKIPVNTSTVLKFVCVGSALGLALNCNFLLLQTALLGVHTAH